jgi:hypothetical protein
MAHIQRMGDVGCRLGEWLGTKGSRQRIEGLGMAPGNGIAQEDIDYQAVLERNWLSPWVEGGKFCGSRGMAPPLLDIKVRLKGASRRQSVRVRLLGYLRRWHRRGPGAGRRSLRSRWPSGDRGVSDR